MKVKVSDVLCVVSVLIALWFVASWADIALHNLTTCEYAPWNVLVLLCK